MKNVYHGNEDGASSPLPHPCHANAPDVMGTDNSWGWCTQAACERLLHLQKPNPSVKPAKDYALLIRSSRHFYYQNTSVEPTDLEMFTICEFPNVAVNCWYYYHTPYEKDYLSVW